MVTVRELRDKEQTGREMYTLAQRFADDLDEFVLEDDPARTLSRATLPEYFSIVRSIPFRKDTNGVEVVTRPFHLFSGPWRGWDCKKKSIAMAAYLQKRGIPWRYLSVSKRPDGEIHHVLVQAKIKGQWRDVDATYPDNQLFEHQPWTAKEVLPAAGPGTLSGAPVLVSMYGEGDPCPALAGEFYQKAARMGAVGTVAAIIAAIVAAVGTVTATIIGVVASNRQAQREHDFQLRYLEEEKQARIETQEAAAVAQKQAQQGSGIPSWLLPAGLVAGAALLLSGEN